MIKLVSTIALVACVAFCGAVSAGSALGTSPRVTMKQVEYDCVSAFFGQSLDVPYSPLQVSWHRDDAINKVLLMPKNVRVLDFSNRILGTAYHIYLIVELSPGKFEVASSPLVPFDVLDEVARTGEVPERYFVDHLALLEALTSELGLAPHALDAKVVGSGSILAFGGKVVRADNRSGHIKGGANSLRKSLEVLPSKGLKLDEQRTVVWDYSVGDPLHAKELQLAQMTIDNTRKRHVWPFSDRIKGNYIKLTKRFGRPNGTYNSEEIERFYTEHESQILQRVASGTTAANPMASLLTALKYYCFMDKSGFAFTFNQTYFDHSKSSEKETANLTLHQAVMDVFLQFVEEQTPASH